MRMITPDHEEQIDRLLLEHFSDRGKGWAWLDKNFDGVREILWCELPQLFCSLSHSPGQAHAALRLK